MKLQKEDYVRMSHKLFYGVPLGHRTLFSAVWSGSGLCLGSGRYFVYVICLEYHYVGVLRLLCLCFRCLCFRLFIHFAFITIFEIIIITQFFFFILLCKILVLFATLQFPWVSWKKYPLRPVGRSKRAKEPVRPAVTIGLIPSNPAKLHWWYVTCAQEVSFYQAFVSFAVLNYF